MDFKKLDELDFTRGFKFIIEFIKRGECISDKDLKSILKLKDKELINSFLEKFENFSTTQLKSLEIYINTILENENSDKDFVSDLIDFSSDWELVLNYRLLISFLDLTGDDNHFILLSTIHYITINIESIFIDELVFKLEKILNTPSYFQNVQISSALCLFKITQNKKYLNEIKDWFDDEINVEFLKNRLKDDCFSKKYINEVSSFLLKI